MKKVLICICIFMAICVFTGCNSSESSLPKGRASTVEIIGDSNTWNMGSGKYEYLNETTIKFIRDLDKKTYYLSTSTLCYIIEE